MNNNLYKTLLICGLVLASTNVIASARWGGLTARQLEIVRTVRSVDGYITEELHREFWGLVPASIRRDPNLRPVMLKYINEMGGARLEFQRETWVSARESLLAGKVVKTRGYERSRLELQNSSSNPLYQKGISNSILSAEKIIDSAANGSFVEIKGPTYLTSQ